MSRERYVLFDQLHLNVEVKVGNEGITSGQRKEALQFCRSLPNIEAHANWLIPAHLKKVLKITVTK